MSWLDSMKITPISGGGAKGSNKGKKERDFAQRRAAKLRESWTFEQIAAEAERIEAEIAAMIAAGKVTQCPPMTPP